MRADRDMVAYRFAQPQAWWAISQLVSRTPEFRLHQQVDFLDGEALVLELTDSTTIPLEVRNQIRVVFGGKGVTVIAPTETGTMPWEKALTAQGSLDVVRGVEIGLGLTPTTGIPRYAKSNIVLVYTVIALLLAARVHDRHLWQVRSLAPVLLGVDGWGLTDLSALPTLERYVMARFELDALRGVQPAEVAAWVLYRGLVPVAAFDEDGGFHCNDVRFRLREVYDGTGCRIHSTTMMVAATISG